MLRDERTPALILGALASLVPVLLTDAHSGSRGLMVEAAILFVAALLLCRRSQLPLRTGLLLLAGTLVAEALALAAHNGLAIFAGTWAPAGAQLLVAVPAVLSGGSVGAWMRERAAGMALALTSVAVGVAGSLALTNSFVIAAVLLAVGSVATAVLRPGYALLWSSLIAGTASMLAVAMFFGQAGGPGHMWPVVLPVQAAIVTPLVYAGGAVGMLIARALGRAPSAA